MRNVLLLALVVLFVPSASAQDAGHAQSASNAARVQVIPRPKRVKLTGEGFALNARTQVTLADAKSEDDLFAARDFIEDVKATAGVELRTGTKPRRPQVLVGPLADARVRAALSRAGAGVPENLSDEGYVLSVRPDEVVVAGKTEAGTFYGLQTLKQLVRGEGGSARVEGVEIVDWPTMRWRAVSDDISRGPVPTVEYFKRQIRTEAMFKLNMHSLYMEHVLRYDSHPLIAPDGGALSPAEIREMVAYARRYHVELVPQQQTF